MSICAVFQVTRMGSKMASKMLKVTRPTSGQWISPPKDSRPAIRILCVYIHLNDSAALVIIGPDWQLITALQQPEMPSGASAFYLCSHPSNVPPLHHILIACCSFLIARVYISINNVSVISRMHIIWYGLMLSLQVFAYWCIERENIVYWFVYCINSISYNYWFLLLIFSLAAQPSLSSLFGWLLPIVLYNTILVFIAT